MIAGPPNSISFATIRDFRRFQKSAAQNGVFDGVIAAYLPLVYGTAASLLPESPATVEKIVIAVFELFAFRCRKLSKKTVVATWLLQTTWFACKRERMRLGLPVPLANAATGENYLLVKELNRLRPKYLNPLVLCSILREAAETASRTLRIKKTRLEKYERLALNKLAKRLRKKKIATEVSNLLERLPQAAPPEFEAVVIDRLHQWSPKEKKSEQIQGILRSWQWVGIKHALKRIALGVGVAICFLSVLATTFGYLAQRGYLTAWFIQMGGRQLAKEIPELTKPAQPWPTSPADQALASAIAPKNSAELFGLTNIWLSKFSFSPEQWKQIAPSHITPIPNLMQSDGRIVLRNPKAHRSGLAGALGIEFNWTESRLEFADQSFSKVAIRYRGNGTYVNSLYGPKQSFKVDLNKFEKTKDIGGVHTLNYVNVVPDNSYLHDALGEEVFRGLGAIGPRTAYSYLTIDVPQKFTNQALGLYLLVENIDSDFAKERFGSKKTPIFKPVTYDLFKDLGEDWKAYGDIYDLKTKATPEQLGRVIDFARLVTHADDKEFARRVGEFLDLEEFAAFLGGHVLLSSYDGFLANGQNYYIYLDPRSDKFGFISWDQDHAWGEFGYIGTNDQREHASIWKPSVCENRFLDRVLKVETFRAIYRRKLERALDHLFTVDRLYRRIDEVAAIIRPAVAAESDFRLKRFDQAISTNWLSGPRDGQSEGPKAPVHQMKRFVVNRIQSVREQLDGKAEGVTPQGNWGRR